MSQGNAPCDIFFYSLSKNYTRESPQMTFINHTKVHFLSVKRPVYHSKPLTPILSIQWLYDAIKHIESCT